MEQAQIVINEVVQDVDLYTATLMADGSMTTCTCTYPDSPKEYVFAIGKDMASTLAAGDYIIVDHNSNPGFFMVKLVEVHDVPDFRWGRRTRTVLAALPATYLEGLQDTVRGFRESVYATAKANVLKQREAEMAKQRAILQEGLGISHIFNSFNQGN